MLFAQCSLGQVSCRELKGQHDHLVPLPHGEQLSRLAALLKTGKSGGGEEGLFPKVTRAEQEGPVCPPRNLTHGKG